MSVTEYCGFAKVDKERIERAVRELLEAMGEKPDREGLVDTPHRIATMYSRIFCGYNELPKITKFPAPHDDIQARKCDFVSTCEHHLTPFAGVAYIAYLPDKWILGMDKLDLIVDYYAARLQLQEVMTHQIAEEVMKQSEAQGVMVQTYGIHFCARYKGNSGSFAESAVRGIFRTDDGLKAEAERMFERLDEMNKVV